MTKELGVTAIILLASLQQPLFSQPNPQASTAPTAAAPASEVSSSSSSIGPGAQFAPIPCKTYCLYAFADYLLLRAQGTDIPYAQPRDAVSPLAVPVAGVATAAAEYSSGFRFGGGMTFGDGNYLQATYTGFHSSTTNMVTAPNGAVIASLLTFPNTPNSALDSTTASIQSKINFNFIDADFKHRFWQCDNGALNWLLGARYAQLQQQMQANYMITGATAVNSNINFNGVGVRAGIEGEYAVGCGLFVFGRGVISLLTGRFNATYVQTNIFAGTEASTGASDTRLVPIVDFEAGAGWQTSNQRIRLMAGYYASIWGNVVSMNNLIQGVQNSNFTTNGNNFRDSIQFNGIMARLEFRY